MATNVRLMKLSGTPVSLPELLLPDLALPSALQQPLLRRESHCPTSALPALLLTPTATLCVTEVYLPILFHLSGYASHKVRFVWIQGQMQAMFCIRVQYDPHCWLRPCWHPFAAAGPQSPGAHSGLQYEQGSTHPAVQWW